MPDQTAQGSSDLAGITELVRAADRLGLTWGLRPGTVNSIAAPFSAREASVQMDGDTVTIPVVSLIGDLIVGDRVMVMRVPPSGEYAIGALNRITPAPPASTTPFTEVSTGEHGPVGSETVVLILDSATLKLGTAYRIEVSATIYAASGLTSQFRVRKTGISGAIWAVSPQFIGAGGTILVPAWWTAFVTPSSADITSQLVVTLQSSAGGTTQVGSADAPRFFSVTPEGPAADYPQSVAVS